MQLDERPSISLRPTRTQRFEIRLLPSLPILPCQTWAMPFWLMFVISDGERMFRGETSGRILEDPEGCRAVLNAWVDIAARRWNVDIANAVAAVMPYDEHGNLLPCQVRVY